MKPSGPIVIVADASVLVKSFLLDESPCPGAELLMNDVARRRVALLEPPFVVQEMVSALARAVRRGRIGGEDASRAVELLLAIRVVTISAELLAVDMADIAMRYGISAYDASYVALADRFGSELFTADERLIAALSGTELPVRSIHDYAR